MALFQQPSSRLVCSLLLPVMATLAMGGCGKKAKPAQNLIQAQRQQPPTQPLDKDWFWQETKCRAANGAETAVRSFTDAKAEWDVLLPHVLENPCHTSVTGLLWGEIGSPQHASTAGTVSEIEFQAAAGTVALKTGATQYLPPASLDYVPGESAFLSAQDDTQKVAYQQTGSNQLLFILPPETGSSPYCTGGNLVLKFVPGKVSQVTQKKAQIKKLIEGDSSSGKSGFLDSFKEYFRLLRHTSAEAKAVQDVEADLNSKKAAEKSAEREVTKAKDALTRHGDKPDDVGKLTVGDLSKVDLNDTTTFRDTTDVTFKNPAGGSDKTLNYGTLRKSVADAEAQVAQKAVDLRSAEAALAAARGGLFPLEKLKEHAETALNQEKEKLRQAQEAKTQAVDQLAGLNKVLNGDGSGSVAAGKKAEKLALSAERSALSASSGVDSVAGLKADVDAKQAGVVAAKKTWDDALSNIRVSKIALDSAETSKLSAGGTLTTAKDALKKAEDELAEAKKLATDGSSEQQAAVQKAVTVAQAALDTAQLALKNKKEAYDKAQAVSELQDYQAALTKLKSDLEAKAKETMHGDREELVLTFLDTVFGVTKPDKNFTGAYNKINSSVFPSIPTKNGRDCAQSLRDAAVAYFNASVMSPIVKKNALGALNTQLDTELGAVQTVIASKNVSSFESSVGYDSLPEVTALKDAQKARAEVEGKTKQALKDAGNPAQRAFDTAKAAYDAELQKAVKAELDAWQQAQKEAAAAETAHQSAVDQHAAAQTQYTQAVARLAVLNGGASSPGSIAALDAEIKKIEAQVATLKADLVTSTGKHDAAINVLTGEVTKLQTAFQAADKDLKDATAVVDVSGALQKAVDAATTAKTVADNTLRVVQQEFDAAKAVAALQLAQQGWDVQKGVLDGQKAAADAALLAAQNDVTAAEGQLTRAQQALTAAYGTDGLTGTEFATHQGWFETDVVKDTSSTDPLTTPGHHILDPSRTCEQANLKTLMGTARAQRAKIQTELDALAALEGKSAGAIAFNVKEPQETVTTHLN